MNSLFPAAIVLAALLVCACNTPDTDQQTNATPIHEAPSNNATLEQAMAEFDVEKHFPGSTKDSLLANLITFIYKRPTTAINRDRTLPEFRSYYVGKLPLFRYAYHQADGSGRHWFYLIRPARSIEGDKRGVGGWFTTNDALEMVTFAEVFNTRIMPEQELREKGLDLFRHMVEHGNVEDHPMREAWVEWPDDRLKYDMEKREWRYVD